MNRLGLGRRVRIAALCVALVSGCLVFNWVRWRQRPDSASGVALELSPARQVIKVGEVPHLAVTVVNRGSQEVVLVEPGDGSECGWRTPEIEWSRGPWLRLTRCGNINALTAEEVFSLRPGESRQLNHWVGGPQLSGPGHYRVAVRYRNRPAHEWFGVPLQEHDEAAMRQVRRSDAVTAVSNSVEIVVER